MKNDNINDANDLDHLADLVLAKILTDTFLFVAVYKLRSLIY